MTTTSTPSGASVSTNARARARTERTESHSRSSRSSATNAIGRRSLTTVVAVAFARAPWNGHANANATQTQTQTQTQARAMQPIDWVLTKSNDDVDFKAMIVDAANDRPYEEREKKEKRDGKSVDAGEDEAGAFDGTTARKFGKLGVILVVADVITAAVMGKSVLGVAKSLEIDASERFEVGEDGVAREIKREPGAEARDWKEKLADELARKFKEKNQGKGGDGSESAE